MGQKLHRGRRSVFYKRRPYLKTFLWIVTALAIVAGGYFVASLADQTPPTAAEVDAKNTTQTTTAPTTQNAPDSTTDPATPEGETVTVKQGIKGFYLPHSALTKSNLADTLTAAKKAGFTAVVFELKDTEGQLYYRFSSPQAKKVGSYTKNALTKAQLKTLFATIKEAGLTPVPRLHAFRDNLGAKALSNARISPKSDASQSWFDGKPHLSSSKRWLNPYDNDAHDYIGALATELKELGAGAVMLDSVQFPNPKIIQKASFGTDNAKLKWDEVLTLFVDKMETLLGEDCPVILACTGESALGTATQVYGGNPLTFGATITAPTISPNKAKKSVESMILRTKVLDEKDQPVLAPMLEIDGVSAAKVKQALTNCAAGGTDSFILYHSKGNYDFAAYQ